jgi:hyperosmotically inducible protein
MMLAGKWKKGESVCSRSSQTSATYHQMKIYTVVFAVLFGASGLVAQTQPTDPSAKPDNTKVNKRDREPGEATADQQKMNSSDRELTKNIRQAIMADKSLSTYAHNIKVISQNGTVTLKGPVRSTEEKESIVSKAVAVVGSADKVNDQIAVKH